jgi:hypothetical protein
LSPSAPESFLRCYLIRECEFPSPNPSLIEQRDITKVGDKNFLYRTTDNTKILFQDLMNKVLDSTGPVIKVLDRKNGEKRLIVGYKYYDLT